MKYIAKFIMRHFQVLFSIVTLFVGVRRESRTFFFVRSFVRTSIVLGMTSAHGLWNA
jgi:hypothetical protein